MPTFPDGYSLVSPSTTIELIARQIPENCRNHLIVVGSLAVGYRYFGGQSEMVVRTKDADCLVSPHLKAIEVGSTITNQLLAAGWTIKPGGEFSAPGTASTQDGDLPVPRLNPPNRRDWFLELLTVPPSPDDRGRRFTRISTSKGDFGLVSFGFIGLTDFEPIKTPFGISVASP